MNEVTGAAPGAIPWHQTRIVCTLGPATDRPGVLEALIAAGMDVARINTSHGTAAEHAARIDRVRGLASATGQPLAILGDLPGPKFRLGDLPGGSRELFDGERVTLRPATDARPTDLPLRDSILLDALAPGEPVYLADGAVHLVVEERREGQVTCRVTTAGTVRGGSGVNVPEARLAALVPTAGDRERIALLCARGVDWLGVSFVQDRDDLDRVRALLPAGNRPLLMAKIEKRRALDNLEAIIAAADGVMVARGDLGVETDPAEIPLVQKRIIARANHAGRPVVTATQMLESMVEHARPTRAEVTDIANAVLDGTDGVMLSGETAIGRFPAAAADMMQRVLRATEQSCGRQLARARLAGDGPDGDEKLAGPLIFTACQLALRLGAAAIVTAAADPGAAAGIARLRPCAPVMVLTADETLRRRLVPTWGVNPLPPASTGDRLAPVRKWLCARKLGRPGDPLVILAASGAGGGRADTLQVVPL